MVTIEQRLIFGYVSKCRDLKEIIQVLKEVVGDEALKATVAFGMLLSAHSTQKGKSRNDALEVLDRLALAKAELDAAACHTHPTIDITAEVLTAAQIYADEATEPCTEWATSDQIIAHVFDVVQKYSKLNGWKRTVKNERGAVVGVESVE